MIFWPGIQGQWMRRKTAILEGDMTIGYLFSMHEQPDQKSAHTRNCGKIWEEYGIQRAEVTFQTIDRINKDDRLLPNITLGVEIRDDCWYAPVALEQTLEFIRDAIATPKLASQSAVDVSRQNRISCVGNAAGNASGNSTGNGPPCPKRKILVGVIGPGSSAVSIQVQNLLQLFDIPQIGYSATSRDLTDKNRFRYFVRVVPPDELQAQAMVQIVQKYNWTYVSAVCTEGSYGQSGMQAFREFADSENICIDKELSILSNDGDDEYDRLLTRLLEEPKTRVIVCFCEGETVNAILKAIRRFNKTGHFLLVGSDGWADRLDVVQGYEAEAEGGISIRIHSPRVPSFDERYLQLKPDKDTRARNPWFEEFWEHRFNCTFAAKAPTNQSAAFGNSSVKLCTGREDLRDKYKQDSKMGFVIKATYAMATALHNLQQSVCGIGSAGLCPAMLPIDGPLLRDHLLNVTFPYENDTVQFDSNGNPPGWYDIMNYQRLPSNRYNYVQIGTWKNGTLTIPENLTKMVTSVCSEPCPTGYVKMIQKEISCCWQCVECDDYQFLPNETMCQDCPMGWEPNETKDGCVEIPVEHIKWSDQKAIAAVTLSVIGLLVTLVTAAIFAWHNETPVVKASTRELTYIILAGMGLCYLTTFPLLAVPNQINCSLSRILPGFSFSMIYAALLTKTNRIARILAGSKKRIRTGKSRWLSATAQVLITLSMILVEVVLIVVMLLLEPADAVADYPTRKRSLLICNTTVRGLMAPLGFDFFLIGMCTIYAVKTRNLPENFNEAKFIGFAMYTTCVIWVAFVPIYFGSESKTITLCFCVSLSALVTLVLLFWPKLYIILCKPEKNNRSAFTTSTDLRIHIAGGTGSHKKVKNATSHPSSTVSNPRNSTYSDLSQEQSTWGHSPFDGLMARKSSSTKIHRLSSQEDAAAIPANPLSRRADPEAAADKGRSNMTFLRRAFGSQIDFTAGVDQPLMEPPSDAATAKHSVHCQTEDSLLQWILPTRRSSDSSAAERPEDAEAVESSASRELESDAEEAEDDHVTIIINLEQPKITSTLHTDPAAGRSSDYLQTLGITVSKTDDQRI